MRIRIIIDTQDAGDPGAADEPFTLNVYQDDEDGTQSRAPLEIEGHGSALIGGRIDVMLTQLAECWGTGRITDEDDQLIPADAKAWRTSLEPKGPVQIATDVMNRAYGPGSDWDNPNQFSETGFTRAQRPEEPDNDRPRRDEGSAPRFVLDPELIHEWTGYRLTREQMNRLATCLPHSSVPEAIGTILSQALGLTPDEEEGAL